MEGLRTINYEGYGTISNAAGTTEHPVHFHLILSDDADERYMDDAARALSLFIMRTRAEMDAILGDN